MTFIYRFKLALPMTKLSAFGFHSSMWPNAITFERAHIDHSMPEAVTVIYFQRPQYLKSHMQCQGYQTTLF